MVNPKTLQEIVIQLTCENITSIVSFINQSPLPWPLTQKIVRAYSGYRWEFIVKNAYKDNSRKLVCLEEMLYTRKILNSRIRNAIICNLRWEQVYDQQNYCVWVNYYKIENLNLILCHSCYKALREVFKLKNISCNIFVIRDHFHLYFRTSFLPQLYRSKKFWCQNDFRTLLFGLKDIEECTSDLHESPHCEPTYPPYYERFIESGDEDSDIDYH